jgi:hypothetical protein
MVGLGSWMHLMHADMLLDELLISMLVVELCFPYRVVHFLRIFFDGFLLNILFSWELL